MGTLANVKLSKKDMLEEIQAKLRLLHKKLSQQELLDKCVEFTQQNFDRFVNDNFADMTLTEEKMALIKKNIYHGEINQPEKTHDELLYGG